MLSLQEIILNDIKEKGVTTIRRINKRTGIHKRVICAILHKQKELGNIFIHNENIKKKKSWSFNKPLYG
tara:strand:+ start:825 stop:1031 length:207 start_codon:yes stop_codon:yes gene_type:complete